jgi:hypothetical protein
MGSFGSTPKDQDGVPLSSAWSETNNALLPVRGAHEHTDINNNTTVTVAIGAGTGDFAAGSIEDLAVLLGLAGTASDPNTAATIMGRLTKIRDLLSAALTISGSVTANAGTNLNTSALALESGGNLATLAGAVSAGKVLTTETNSSSIKSDLDTLSAIVSSNKAAVKSATGDIVDLATIAGAISSSKMQATIAAIAASLSQANQVPVSNSAPQGKLTITGTLSANSDNSLTFSGGATVARRIRIQNESSGPIYWETDATASAGSPSLAAPAANAVSVEWIAVQCSALHIFIPSGGTTTLNGSGGVKVTAYA